MTNSDPDSMAGIQFFSYTCRESCLCCWRQLIECIAFASVKVDNWDSWFFLIGVVWMSFRNFLIEKVIKRFMLCLYIGMLV